MYMYICYISLTGTNVKYVLIIHINNDVSELMLDIMAIVLSWLFAIQLKNRIVDLTN